MNYLTDEMQENPATIIASIMEAKLGFVVESTAMLQTQIRMAFKGEEGIPELIEVLDQPI